MWIKTDSSFTFRIWRQPLSNRFFHSAMQKAYVRLRSRIGPEKPVLIPQLASGTGKGVPACSVHNLSGWVPKLF